MTQQILTITFSHYLRSGINPNMKAGRNGSEIRVAFACCVNFTLVRDWLKKVTWGNNRATNIWLQKHIVDSNTIRTCEDCVCRQSGNADVTLGLNNLLIGSNYFGSCCGLLAMPSASLLLSNTHNISIQFPEMSLVRFQQLSLHNVWRSTRGPTSLTLKPHHVYNMPRTRLLSSSPDKPIKRGRPGEAIRDTWRIMIRARAGYKTMWASNSLALASEASRGRRCSLARLKAATQSDWLESSCMQNGGAARRLALNPLGSCGGSG